MLKRNKQHVNAFNNLKNTKIVATSNFIHKSLTSAGLRVDDIMPITPTTFEKNPKARGDKVYFYGDRTKYGVRTMQAVKNLIPYEIIWAKNAKAFSRQELQKIYEDCYIGLMEGNVILLSGTVQSSGYLEIKCNNNTYEGLGSTSRNQNYFKLQPSSGVINTLEIKNSKCLVDSDASDGIVMIDADCKYIDISEYSGTNTSYAMVNLQNSLSSKVRIKIENYFGTYRCDCVTQDRWNYYY